jgi:hypothetical protein
MGPPPPKSRPSAEFRSIAQAESLFASTITNFLNGFPPHQRTYVVQICASWAAAWSRSALVGLQPPSGVGREKVATEFHRSYWKDYYQRNREHILQRARRNYHRRRNGQQHQQLPTDV